MTEKIKVKDFFSPNGAGYDWWKSIQPKESKAELKESKVHLGGDRAELRRCKSISEILITPAFYRLRNRAMSVAVHDETLAAIAGVLANVDESTSERFGQAMATKKEKSDNAKVSGLRFRRLLEHKDLDELYLPLVRIVRMMGRTVPIGSLAADIAMWAWEDGRDRVRKDWARDYYTTNADET
jgi:CRISPR type I-E-associated protein CasB/Cse2